MIVPWRGLPQGFVRAVTVVEESQWNDCASLRSISVFMHSQDEKNRVHLQFIMACAVVSHETEIMGPRASSSS